MYVAILLETIIATQIIAGFHNKARAWSIAGFYYFLYQPFNILDMTDIVI